MPPSVAATDEPAIRTVDQRLMDGWNAHSAAAFAADADCVVVTGQHVTRRAAIRAGHEGIFNTIYRDSHNQYAVEQIRRLRQEVALAHVRARLQFQAAGSAQAAHARIRLVLLKEADEWQVAAFQSTAIQEG